MGTLVVFDKNYRGKKFFSFGQLEENDEQNMTDIYSIYLATIILAILRLMLDALAANL